tara:strand:- start:686 stop:1504 length:819 start_codon:yes stop_codon:yes gene_type:complete
MTSLPNPQTLDLQLENEWLTIWFNQSEKRNALTDELRSDLQTVLTSVRNDRGVRGITLRGRGGVFCAGGDLKHFQSDFQAGASLADIRVMSRDAAAIMDAVNTAPQVVIVLVEGAAMAGGFGIACCGDVVICEDKARFAMTETALGLSPAQIAPFVIQKLGYAVARRLMVTAERFDGSRALALGFADFTAPNVEELEAIEAEIRSRVLRCAPGAIAETKELIRQLPALGREDAIEAAADNFARRMKTDEAKEGISAFFDKRPAKWAARPVTT